MSTAAGRRHMGRVAGSCCILCRHLRLADDSPAEVHHVRAGSGKMRASDFDTIALCPPHHRIGPDAFHVLGTKAFARRYGVTEADLLVATNQLLGIE
jgi:hypothetical protein